MRTIFLAIIVAALPTWVAAAEQSSEQPRKPAVTPRPVKNNPCAAYGAGFVQIQGSSTCIKIGGSISVDIGGRIGR